MSLGQIPGADARVVSDVATELLEPLEMRAGVVVGDEYFHGSII